MTDLAQLPIVQPNAYLLAFLWLVGIPAGLAIRFGFWAAKQTVPVTVGTWWRARLGSNVISITLGLIVTGFWTEGSLYRVAHLEKLGVELTTGLTPIVSMAVTIFAHYILATGKRRAEALAGGAPPDGD